MNVAEQAETYLRAQASEISTTSTEDTRSREVLEDIAEARAEAVPPTDEYLAAKAALRKRKPPDAR